MEKITNKSKNIKDVITEKDEDKLDSFISPEEKSNNKNKYEYFVKNYDDSCEDFSKIEKILSLRKNSFKFCIFVLFSIITLGILNLFVVWFPKLKLFLIYSLCDMETASHFGIFGCDDYFHVVNAQILHLPEIEDSHLRNYCIFNVSDSRVKLFEFKLFKYLYNSKEECFVSLKFNIKTSMENLHTYFTVGLSQKECSHQMGIFGKCDLEINVDSVLKLIFKEVSDPFYLFQVFSVTLWFYTQYYYYSSVIVFTTFVSIALSVYETRVNLINIQKMARYSCNVKVIRKDQVEFN